MSDLTHARFQQQLRASEPARAAMADWWRARGYTVEMKPLRVAPTANEQPDYADDGDLRVSGAGLPRVRIVEVKHRRQLHYRTDAEFAAHHERYDGTTIIEKARIVDAPDFDVWCYQLVSADLSAVWGVGVASTRRDWTTVVAPDQTGIRQRVYRCPTHLGAVRVV